jgi:hypothetical protein
MDKIKISLIIVAVLAVTLIVGVTISTDGLTGGTIIKNVNCYDSVDCNDHQEKTLDFCQNPGEENSLCVNKPIE